MGEKNRRIGKWLIQKSLGSGGQGEVFLARAIDSEWSSRSLDRLRELLSGVRLGSKEAQADQFYDVFAEFSLAQVGALKRLRPWDQLPNPRAGVERFRRELNSLRGNSHPSLIKILDASEGETESWFVMEYHARGSLTQHLGLFKGNAIGALTAIRPLVEAVSLLHEQKQVHRDIKPDNILVGDAGHLVLGDFGIIFDGTVDKSRVTETYENVGSRDWMPTWAQGARIEDVPVSFDVFGLGKTLWAMIAGAKFLRLHYFEEAEFNLAFKFPNDTSMPLVNKFLGNCIVEHRGRGYADAGQMLRELDKLQVDILRERLGRPEGDTTLPAKLFPGVWKLSYRGPSVQGEESVRFDDKGLYRVNDRPVFQAVASLECGKEQILLRKRRLDGQQEILEHLFQWRPNIWSGADQFGNTVVYERQFLGPQANTASQISVAL